jgi:hypothetical protein
MDSVFLAIAILGLVAYLAGLSYMMWENREK